MNPALKALIPSKATVARMMPKPAELDRALASIRRHDAKAKPRRKYGGYIPRPSHPVRIAAEGLGRFTVRDLALFTGEKENNVLMTLTCMRHARLARIVTPSGYPVAVYERLAGGSLEGRAKTPGMAWIEAQPVGATFGFADIPGSRFQRAAAVERARKVGMVRRISARRTYSIWEVVK